MSVFNFFKKGLDKGHNSQTIADICINFTAIDSLRKTTAGH
jgi:hypothetical protein